MDTRQANQFPWRRVAGFTALALLLGVAMPVVGLFQVMLLVPVLMLGGMLTVWLKARAGWVPAGALVAVATGVATWLMGFRVSMMMFVAALVPAVPVIWGMTRKRPFFEQLRGGVVAFAAGLIAATMIAYAGFGSGMVAQFTDVLRAEYDRMPDAALQPFVEWTNSMLSASGVADMTVHSFRGQLSGILDLMEQTYAQALPGMLLCGAMLSGVLAVLWGNWTMARQGYATNESFIGMSQWFLPAQVSLGALGFWAVGLGLSYSGYASGGTVSFTINEVVGAVFAIQALAALDRRMLRGGLSVARRRVLITLLAALALILRDIGAVLCYVGVASALFGSRGAFRLWQQKRENNHSNHDDTQE